MSSFGPIRLCLVVMRTKQYDWKLVLVNGLFLLQCTLQVCSKFNTENNLASRIVTRHLVTLVPCVTTLKLGCVH